MTLPSCWGCDMYDNEKDGCTAKYDANKTCTEGSLYRPKGKSNFKGCPHCHCVHGKYPSLEAVLNIMMHQPEVICQLAAKNYVRWAMRGAAKRCTECAMPQEMKYPLGACNPFRSCAGPVLKLPCRQCQKTTLVNNEGICEECWDYYVMEVKSRTELTPKT